MKGFYCALDDKYFLIQTPYHPKIKEELSRIGSDSYDNETKAYKFDMPKKQEVIDALLALNVSIEAVVSLPPPFTGPRVALVKEESDGLRFEVYIPYDAKAIDLFRKCDGKFMSDTYRWSMPIANFEFCELTLISYGFEVKAVDDFPEPKIPPLKV